MCSAVPALAELDHRRHAWPQVVPSWHAQHTIYMHGCVAAAIDSVPRVLAIQDHRFRGMLCVFPPGASAASDGTRALTRSVTTPHCAGVSLRWRAQGSACAEGLQEPLSDWVVMWRVTVDAARKGPECEVTLGDFASHAEHASAPARENELS